MTTVCAGRTDAGVHATGQVIHFDTPARRPDKAWVMGSNSNLPADVAVRWAQPVDDGFHARFSTVDRTYAYLVREGMDRPALWGGRAAWSAAALDERAMARAAAALVGEHDFSAFRSAACQAPNPVRRIERVTVARHERVIRIDVRGNAFLHNMVRIIAGSLMAVGRGDREPGWIAEVLAARERTRAAATAPAEGLYFLGPRYPERFGLPPAGGPLWPGDPQ
ncbi:MAG: tRNA pseudouridine(38-40) synthase TruA [Halofilum sp. (in: g-proteobacteria)]|nr:tRNA pseudouridine(38-40) synthase TruA [Halofilum sp. (in: g-proteobacteria)]